MNMNYANRLLETLGSDQFAIVYEAIKALGREDVVAIADAFNGPIAKSAPKNKALAAIWSRHRKLLEF
jgi:hypothetical protein